MVRRRRRLRNPAARSGPATGRVRVVLGAFGPPVQRPVPVRHGRQATQPAWDRISRRARENGGMTERGGGITGDHYFSARPGTPARPTEVVVAAGGLELRLHAGGGVFSANRLDPGT